ncbi:hypothetical protein BDY19DRAFT_1056955 [Irpex rosettiformis]|uniref:Uncharacterized protein n=1 Tax=Irpex rosettiformis TaxID=378272 RepID=A0ACB8U3E9_9APHY|nr:hypothetical protein BDY19DRAFT_1056955 [Irpex rosettiformis]
MPSSFTSQVSSPYSQPWIGEHRLFALLYYPVTQLAHALPPDCEWPSEFFLVHSRSIQVLFFARVLPLKTPLDKYSASSGHGVTNTVRGVVFRAALLGAQHVEIAEITSGMGADVIVYLLN